MKWLIKHWKWLVGALAGVCILIWALLNRYPNEPKPKYYNPLKKALDKSAADAARDVDKIKADVAKNSKLTGADAKKFVDDVLKSEDK
jgi:hypothetical protein